MGTGADGATLALLLALCRSKLTAEERGQAGELLHQAIDWPLLTHLAALQGVNGLVRHSLLALEAQPLVPEAQWRAMEQAAAQVAFDGMLALRLLAQVVQALQAAGIQPIVLKGHALADLLYSDPVLRPSADIDLLIRGHQLSQACTVLEDHECRLPPQAEIDFQLAHSYDLALGLPPLAGRQLLLELHWNLAPRGLFALNLDRWWERAELFELEAGSAVAWRFSVEDTLLHLALHMRKHRYVGLRWLCDVAELLRRFGATLDWEYTMETAQEAGLRTLLFTTLLLASRLLKAPTVPAVLERLGPPVWRRWLLRSVLEQDVPLRPLEMEEPGWTRLAPNEVLLLDRPGAMFSELRYRLFPPTTGLVGSQAVDMSRGQRLSLGARRLARRTATLLRR